MAAPAISTNTITSEKGNGQISLDVRVPPDVPLDVTDVSFEQSGGVLRLVSYNLVNKGQAPVVTAITRWTYYGQDTTQRTSVDDMVDSWEMPDAALPGGSTLKRSEHFEVRGAEVGKIAIDFVYVEFDSGRLAGLMPNCISEKLAAQRSAKLAAYKALVNRFTAASASSEELDAYVAKQRDLDWLKLVRATSGTTSMLDAAYRVLQLRSNATPVPH